MTVPGTVPDGKATVVRIGEVMAPGPGYGAVMVVYPALDVIGGGLGLVVSDGGVVLEQGVSRMVDGLGPGLPFVSDTRTDASVTVEMKVGAPVTVSVMSPSKQYVPSAVKALAIRPSKRYRVASAGQVDGGTESTNAELRAAVDSDSKPNLADDPRGNMSHRLKS